MGPVLGTTSSSTSSSSSATQTVEYDPNHQSGGSCNTSLAAFRTSTGETITGKIFRETDAVDEEPATEAEAEAEQVEEELDAELFDVAADAGIQAAFLAEDA
eukprot:tig00020704_g13184.t1